MSDSDKNKDETDNGIVSYYNVTPVNSNCESATGWTLEGNDSDEK